MAVIFDKLLGELLLHSHTSANDLLYLKLSGSNANQNISIGSYELSAYILKSTSATTGQSTIGAGLVVNNNSGNGAINDFQVNSDSFTAIFVDASADTMAIGVDIDFNKDVYLNAKLFDVNNSEGTSGQVLSSTGSGVDWIDLSSHKLAVTTKTTNYTATTSDNVILVNASSGDVTITLPASSSGLNFTVKKIDSSSNTVTVASNGSETIDGSSTQVIISQYDAISLVSDGSNFYII